MGLHARVATMVVRTMSKYRCRVTLMKDGVEVDAGSVLGLLLLAATQGSEVLIKGSGPDCRQAIEEISSILQDENGSQVQD